MPIVESALSAAHDFEELFLDYATEDERNLVAERELHHGPTGKGNRHNPGGLDRWSGKHAAEEQRIGRLPYAPSIFRSQRIDQAERKLTPLAIFLPETTHIKRLGQLHAKVVGSAALANSMIEAFNNTPAILGEELSLTDWAIANLEAGTSFGISSAHSDRLQDVAEFTASLELSVAAREGRKYFKNFKLLVNKNMTRETYSVGGIPIPISVLASLGLDCYWGLPPGESLEENRISGRAADAVNSALIDQFRKDRKKGSVAMGFVPAGSRMIKKHNAESKELEELGFKKTYTGSIMLRLSGGIVTANRFGNEFEIGQVVTIDRGERTKTKYELEDDVVHQHALQIARLSGVTVRYTAVSGADQGQKVLVSPEPSRGVRSIDEPLFSNL